MTENSQSITVFGKMPDGQNVDLICIQGGGLTANIITYGASVQDLRLQNHPAPLVLGFTKLEPYLTEGRYVGASVGRFANRIANGQFSIDGESYQTNQNFNNLHTLHGGAEGISQQIWNIVDSGKSHVTLTFHEQHLATGFPGNCKHTCHYELKNDGVLEVTYTTASDATTVANLAHHSYFILDETGNCLNHLVKINADRYLPVDEGLIPTGAVQSVENTPYDFRTLKPIHAHLAGDVIYDHNFCLSNQQTDLREIAVVKSEQSGISLKVATTEPGLQFYAAHGMKIKADGLQGKPYKAYSGFCLEAQNWPDAPNQIGFPNPVLKAGETLKQVTRYQFSKTS